MRWTRAPTTSSAKREKRWSEREPWRLWPAAACLTTGAATWCMLDEQLMPGSDATDAMPEVDSNYRPTVITGNMLDSVYVHYFCGHRRVVWP